MDECRAGHGPVLIEVKTHRMKGHAQHEPAEYVPKEMVEYWKARDPIVRYEKFLTENKIWDAKTKSEIDARIERELDEDQKFAEDSPLPPPELAEQGVYCDGCHTIKADWQRSKKELTPPNCSVDRGLGSEIIRLARSGRSSGDESGCRIETGRAGRGFGVVKADSGRPRQWRAATTRFQIVPKPPQKQFSKPPAKAPVEEKESIETAAALRVPFGRGPKDKAFRQERQEKEKTRRDKRGRR